MLVSVRASSAENTGVPVLGAHMPHPERFSAPGRGTPLCFEHSSASGGGPPLFGEHWSAQNRGHPGLGTRVLLALMRRLAGMGLLTFSINVTLECQRFAEMYPV
ncbi:MAG: hypothetical protein RL685_6082 [Pseudomonadota bacterium]|jgi:hypothetical protein